MGTNVSVSQEGSGVQTVNTGSGSQKVKMDINKMVNERDESNKGSLTRCKSTAGPSSTTNERQISSREATSASYFQPQSRDEFHIAIICAKEVEVDAVFLLLDGIWGRKKDIYGRVFGDNNTYWNGRIGEHNVVISLLPDMGTAAAASATANLRSSYRAITLAFLVGICGGVPGNGSEERLLGDVVISKSIKYGVGELYPKSFVAKDTMEQGSGGLNKNHRSLIKSFNTEFGREGLLEQAAEYLQDLQDAANRRGRTTNFRYPGVHEDKLFEGTYRHKHRDSQACSLCRPQVVGHCKVAASASCAELHCDKRKLLSRQRLAMKKKWSEDQAQRPNIHIGRILSANIVLKSGEHRDELMKEHDVIAFEMEGAGAWEEVPCIIVKGISDYADSHKNDVWQPFAAATAAAVMKAVLERYAVTDR